MSIAGAAPPPTAAVGIVRAEEPVRSDPDLPRQRVHLLVHASGVTAAVHSMPTTTALMGLLSFQLWRCWPAALPSQAHEVRRGRQRQDKVGAHARTRRAHRRDGIHDRHGRRHQGAVDRIAD
jgi:hypothetical protein